MISSDLTRDQVVGFFGKLISAKQTYAVFKYLRMQAQQWASKAQKAAAKSGQKDHK